MDVFWVGLTATLIVGLILSQVFRRTFDPFAPIWLFLAGYAQIYVVQAISYRDYAFRVRGEVVTTAANFRSFWALVVFFAVYHSGVAKKIASKLPAAPSQWPTAMVVGLSPLLVFWGLVCSVLSLRLGTIGGEESILVQFPMLMLVGGVILLVTGRNRDQPKPVLTLAGVLVCAAYSAIWMFNAKRSHALFGVLAGVCAYYLPRWKRPSMPIMAVTGLACALSVSIAIGWRGTTRYEQSVNGFFQYLSEFNVSSILVNFNLKERDEVDPDARELVSKETEEYGGFLLMMDTVPHKSPYDYGWSYMRIFSTFIPRVIWPDKPLYGRHEWVSAWIAGSEFPRDTYFTGPAIGVLGATQLNGGGIATAIVMSALALIMRTAYDYYRYYAATPWAQAWWTLTYFNSWLMTANDDPFVWFYYVYGYTTLPVMAALWIGLRALTAPAQSSAEWAPSAA
ncbi:MAG: hypothetical protein JWN86_2421 [Planctomycetota bacterium]|nr:hypothetical protein [Planctomycetota bacterium]